MWQAAPRTHGSDDVKRRLLIVAVFLLAGAVVNVAVAWGFVITSQKRSSISIVPWPDSEAKSDWPLAVPDDWPSWANYSGGSASVGRTMTAAGTVDWRYQIFVHQTGLPLRSVEYHALATFSLDFQRSERTSVAAWQTGTFVGTLPLRPIWPGFAVNTLFYAAALWLLIPGPFALRRFIRVKRGLCPACAYPRGESDVCSECGKALPERVKVTPLARLRGQHALLQLHRLRSRGGVRLCLAWPP